MQNIKAILAQLSQELRRAEDIDIEAREILHKLHQDVDELDESGGTEVETLVDRVKELESRFAASHPVLEKIARELADALAKMGV